MHGGGRGVEARPNLHHKGIPDEKYGGGVERSAGFEG